MAKKIEVDLELITKGFDQGIDVAKGMLNTLQAIEEVKEWIQLATTWTAEWAKNLREVGDAMTASNADVYLGSLEQMSALSSDLANSVFPELSSMIQDASKHLAKFFGQVDKKAIGEIISAVAGLSVAAIESIVAIMQVGANSVGFFSYAMDQYTLKTQKTGTTVGDALENAAGGVAALLQGHKQAAAYAKQHGTWLDILLGRDPNNKTRENEIKSVDAAVKNSMTANADRLNKINDIANNLRETLKNIRFDLESGNLGPPEETHTKEWLDDAAKAAAEANKYWDMELVKWQIKWSNLIKQHEKSMADASLGYAQGIEKEKTRLLEARFKIAETEEKRIAAIRKHNRDLEKEFARQQVQEIFNVGAAIQNEVVGRLQDALMNGKSLQEVFKNFDLGKFLLAESIGGLFNIFGNVLSGGIMGALGLGKFSGGPIKHMASGGMPGQDNTLALLDPGEYVIPSNVVNAIKRDKRIEPQIGNQSRGGGMSVVIMAQPIDDPNYWDEIVTKHLAPSLVRRGFA